jgi:hypothetical protein
MPIDSLIYEESVDKKGNQKFVLRGFEGMNKAQAIGSLITYFRRYSLSSMLGIITDKDTDATSGNIVVDITPDDAFKNAKEDIENANNLDVLMDIEKGISKSKILTDKQKEELSFISNERRETFDPTK